ncbi:bifunctional ADP-dependent NAD(P)H-hydrate dehydratase/NAD(P)H-hydrate epimerase [Pandoraea terrae]
MRAVEQHSASGLPPHTLMARAGAAAADWLHARLSASATAGRRPVLVLAGPGNNGGDAYIVACELASRGVAVQIWQTAAPTAEDARWAHARAVAAQLPIAPPPTAWPDGMAFDWVIDGLFGIGLTRPLEGKTAALVEQLNDRRLRVLALDIPSGLQADTGQSAGPIVNATATLAFLGATPGLFTGLGRDVAGDVDVADLGVSSALGQVDAAATSVTPGTFAHALPQRRHASHKGSHGSLGVLGGHDGMVGAPLLSARAALFSGAGRVYAGFVTQSYPAYDAGQPELMLRNAEDIDVASMQALAIGPGLGTDAAASACLARALARPDVPLVLDADALNLLAAEPALAERVRTRGGATVLTPHPLEAARLAGCDVSHVQSDRLAAARGLARQFRAVVVLKGSGTIVDDGKRAWINPTGNPALATAGTGDVLTGLAGALLAQGMDAANAALAAVWLHGRAADNLVANGTGPAGLTASELLPAIRDELNLQMRAARR